MQDIQFHAPFFAYTILYLTALAVLLSIRKLTGKGWVISFLVIDAVTQIYYYGLNLLLRTNAFSYEEYNAIFDARI